jgi:hypothetical protein
MATYYGTYGQKVQYLASDPASPQNGQVWFNSTSNLLKVGVTQQGAWATGGNLATGRFFLGGAGTQTAGLAFGGETQVHLQQSQKNMMELLGRGGNLATARSVLQGQVLKQLL